MFGYEEDSDDMGTIPRERSNLDIPEPEPEPESSLASVSSNFSSPSKTKNEMSFSKTIDLSKTFPEKRKKLKCNTTDEQIEKALEGEDLDEMIRQAALMVTGLSYKFVSIKKQIDDNEVKIRKMEETLLKEQQRKIRL